MCTVRHSEKSSQAFRACTVAILVVFLSLVASMSAHAAAPSPPSGLRVGGFPGGQIRISWTDNSADETSFRLERSIHNRSGYALLTTLPANTAAYTDSAATPETTYWYRVQACNGDGCSAYSKDSFNVSFAAGSLPNLDERYALFLVNESRADPAAYGYPAYSPLPPVAHNALLTYAAHSHSQAILNSDFGIGHCYPDPPSSLPDTEYRCPTERARDVGYLGGVSENLIAGSDGWEATRGAHQAFMDSEGHRNNILDPGAKEAGLGHTYDPHKGGAWHGQYTYTFCGWNPVSMPALPSGIVLPYWGRETTEFTFLVNFYNQGGTGPSQAHVVVDGVSHAMALRHGTSANGSYAYTTTLDRGAHTYYFDFQYGAAQHARLPESGAFSGPDVEVGAAVLEVPAEYPTLAGALAHARGDVIVQLAQGTFYEDTPLGIPNSGIWIQGAGIDKTIIHGDGSGHVLEAHVDALIRDLTITGGNLDGYFDSGVWNTSGHVELRNCRITGNSVGLFTWCFQHDCDAVVTVTNSILDHNQRIAVDANEYGVHHLVNSTVVMNGTGIVLNNVASSIENSIVTSNTGTGLNGSNKSPLARYNDVWGNGSDYQGVAPGIGDISGDPHFEDGNLADYRLQLGSPCIDAGNPASEYNDRNGSRNDMGAYGGPYAILVLESRASAPATATSAFTVSWQGYAADGIESYDIQYRVGESGAWNDWLVRTTDTEAQFGPDDPVSLVPGSAYYFRSRVRDLLGNVEDYPTQADARTLFSVTYDHEQYLPLVWKGTP
jgi:uncharacterized protein YkwD